jgi:hypothetical protein
MARILPEPRGDDAPAIASIIGELSQLFISDGLEGKTQQPDRGAESVDPREIRILIGQDMSHGEKDDDSLKTL